MFSSIVSIYGSRSVDSLVGCHHIG